MFWKIHTPCWNTVKPVDYQNHTPPSRESNFCLRIDFRENHCFNFSFAENTLVNITRRSSKMRICCFIFSNVIVTTTHARRRSWKKKEMHIKISTHKKLQHHNNSIPAKMCHLDSLEANLTKCRKTRRFKEPHNKSND